jgi:hypothetical protein
VALHRDETGRDRVHGDAERGQFAGPAECQADLCALGGGCPVSLNLVRGQPADLHRPDSVRQLPRRCLTESRPPTPNGTVVSFNLGRGCRFAQSRLLAGAGRTHLARAGLIPRHFQP